MPVVIVLQNAPGKPGARQFFESGCVAPDSSRAVEIPASGRREAITCPLPSAIDLLLRHFRERGPGHSRNQAVWEPVRLPGLVRQVKRNCGRYSRQSARSSQTFCSTSASIDMYRRFWEAERGLQTARAAARKPTEIPFGACRRNRSGRGPPAHGPRLWQCVRVSSSAAPQLSLCL
jgi:hypothetical protein